MFGFTNQGWLGRQALQVLVDLYHRMSLLLQIVTRKATNCMQADAARLFSTRYCTRLGKLVETSRPSEKKKHGNARCDLDTD